MTIRNLEHAFRPRSVAVIGASNRAGSVGRIVMRNIVEGGFEGGIWPINPKYTEVENRRCHARVADLTEAPDLGIIVTPPATVPGLITELAEKGTRAAVVITAGLTHANGLRKAMLEAAAPHLFRVIGPNTLGLMIPPIGLNASFGHMAPRAGGLALLSQSGAIATSLVDWAADEGLGFSHIVSLGDMADVDVGDYIDLLAGDAATRAILLYLETIPNPRKFLTAARAASRLKPLIAIKSGRHAAAATAAATHTGALSGADRVVDAALSRAGILRVNTLDELFDAAETVARFRPLARSRVGIVTNGGGAGVLAVDRLADLGAEPATLSPATIEKLDRALPETWSRANPVDIIGDAPAERYAKAIEAVAEDDGTDCIMVLNCPTGLASPVGAARGVAALTENGLVRGKPVLTCWLGEKTAREGRAVLQEAGIASFSSPANAAAAVAHLAGWSRAQEALMRVPAARSEDVRGERDTVRAILREVAADHRRMLTEPEAKAVIAAYGIPVPPVVTARSLDEVEQGAAELLERGGRVVVKLVSKAITHKSDVGGVVLNLETARAAREAAQSVVRRVRASRPDADIEGFAVQPMIARPHAQELIIGMSSDPIFGPVVLFGAGGVSVEVADDTAMALPPLDDVLAADLVSRTRVGRLLAGYRDRAPADQKAIAAALNGLSQLIVDMPCIVGIDINPLLADADGVVALDARIEIDPGRVEETGPNRELAIRPYPDEWQRRFDLDGSSFDVRPIKPADVGLYPAFLEKVSPEDIRRRFLAPRKTFPAEMLARLTQLDYEREMAFVALDAEDGTLAGIARLACDPQRVNAEYGLIVRSDLQGHGLGRAMLELLVDYAWAEGIGSIEGFVLDENEAMLDMCRRFGFTAEQHPDEPGVTLVRLDLSRAERPAHKRAASG
jgi:acetyltransferase